MTDSQSVRAPRLPMTVLLTALAVALIALALYTRTVRSQVGPSLDSTELHLAAVMNGVVHPPGSPQYVILSRLAAFALPGPDPAYRVNLFSALSMAAAVGLLHLVTYRLTAHNIISALAALAFAVGPRMWYLGSVAELYALNSLYLALVLYLLITWHQTRRPALYWASAAVYALSFGNHTSMLMLLPAFLYTVAITDHRMLTRPRNFLLTLAIVLLAAAQYLQIYVRAQANPPYCNFCPPTYRPGWFLDYVTGSDFRAGFFDLPKRDILARISESMQQFSIQFMPWGMALGVIGLWEMARRAWKMALLLALGLAAEWTFIMGYDIPDWHDFLTPSYVLFTPLIGYGALQVWNALPRPLPMLPEQRARWFGLARRVLAPALILAVLLAHALKVAEYYPNMREVTQTDWAPKAAAILSAAGSDETWVMMPYWSSAAYYYSYSLPYYAYLNDVSTLTVIPPPDVPLPLGNLPWYRAWKTVAYDLETEGLLQAKRAGETRRLFVIDPTEARVADWGLYPICVPGEELIAGYEVVAVRTGGEVMPLVAAARWSEVEPWVVFSGEPASCPR